MNKEVILNVDPDVRRIVSGRIEEDEVAELQVAFPHGHTGLVLLFCLTRQESLDGTRVDIAGEPGTVNAVFGIAPVLVRGAQIRNRIEQHGIPVQSPGSDIAVSCLRGKFFPERVDIHLLVVFPGHFFFDPGGKAEFVIILNDAVGRRVLGPKTRGRR